MEKLLSIVIPTYKRTKELTRALEALASQYDERIEILICDDASPDNTQEIIEEFQKKIPIRYIRNTTNLGFDRNFIRCFREATGRFVLMMGNDDFLVQGGLTHIISYLEKNDDVDWTFVNLAPFRGDPSYLKANYTAKKPIIKDRVHISKKEFIEYVWSDITAISSIIRKENLQTIKNQEKYIGTYFLHTCLWLESTKNDNSVLGIIGKPCIAYHYTDVSSDVIWEPAEFFKAFYKGYKIIFCKIGFKCGYDKKQMNDIFVDRCGAIGTLLRMNASRTKGWRKSFWELAYPAIKDFPSICRKMDLNKLHNILEKALISTSYESSEYVTNYLGGLKTNDIVPRHVLGKPQLMTFEDAELYAPEKINEYLTKLYGDYMELPPENQRVFKHNYYVLNFDIPYREYMINGKDTDEK